MPAALPLALIIAVGAAVRGNWSPCGESLQAQIHPLGERSRGNVWAVTISAFTIASMGAGATLAAFTGWLGSFASIEPQITLAAVAALGVVAGALDLSPLKPWTPRRQVNENWIGRYRGWVYGGAFGIQLGLGFAVFVMSWGYYAMLIAAFLIGSPAAGAVIGATFGLFRGLLLLMGRRIDTPERLQTFHRRMSELKRPVFNVTGAAMIAAGLATLI